MNPVSAFKHAFSSVPRLTIAETAVLGAALTWAEARQAYRERNSLVRFAEMEKAERLLVSAVDVLAVERQEH